MGAVETPNLTYKGTPSTTQQRDWHYRRDVHPMPDTQEALNDLQIFCKSANAKDLQVVDSLLRVRHGVDIPTVMPVALLVDGVPL
eukprot:640437-Prorocentrum_minimum.AAC.3